MDRVEDQVISNIDVFAAVGAKTAYIRDVPVTVTDNEIDIAFTHKVGDPHIFAIEYWPID